MNNGIIQTALTGMALELEYRPRPAYGRSSTISEQFTDSGLPSQQSEQTASDEFACLLSVI